MNECKHYYSEFGVCCNSKCPTCAQECPVPDVPGVCMYEDRIPKEDRIAKSEEVRG